MLSPFKGKMIMKKPISHISGFAFAASLLFGVSAMAQTVSPAEFKTSKTRIEADYKTEKAACDSQSGNAKDICIAQAKGKESVALAELDDSYTPTTKTAYKARVAKAEAAYDVAKLQCDDLSGNPKDVCIKKAKADLTSARADATARMKTATANITANEKTSAAKTEASSEAQKARADASAEKRAAQYKVEEEKCNALASTAKDTCLSQAKARYGAP
jgi:hypothetical protein